MNTDHSSLRQINIIPEQNPQIRRNTAVTYTDGTSEIFDALQVTDHGIVIGRIYLKEDGGNEFVKYGIIPLPSIRYIAPL